MAYAISYGHSNSSGYSKTGKEARKLVERGAPLRTIAELLEVPWAFKRVKPGAVYRLREVGRMDEQFVHAYLPQTTLQQQIWLRVLGNFESSAEFRAWAARHMFELGGKSTEQVLQTLQDLNDWAGAGPNNHFITRRFDPGMSVRTVRQLSEAWHEASATAKSSSNAAFPAAWLPATKINDFEIVPIKTVADLYREGRAMHHCVSSYSDTVFDGDVYVFSMRKNGERVATIALRRENVDHDKKEIFIEQMRGPCNAAVPKDAMRVARKWIRGAHHEK